MNETEHERAECKCGDPLLRTRSSGKPSHVICRLCQSAVRTKILSQLTRSWGGQLLNRVDDFEQDFYQTQLLRQHAFHSYDPAKGTFRDWLKGAAGNHCRSLARREKIPVELDEASYDEASYVNSGSRGKCAATREWAKEIVRLSLDAAKRRWRRRLRVPDFEVLRPFLIGPEPDHRVVAAALGITPNYLSKHIQRLRGLWAREIWRVVDLTLDDGDDGPAGSPSPGPRRTPGGAGSGSSREQRIRAEIRLLFFTLFDD